MCTYGIGLPFDHPIWQNLPQCTCGGLTLPPAWDNPPRVRFDDFGVRVELEPVIIAPALPPARGRRAGRKRYEAPLR